ncbi:MAG: zf-HC2 domain-containing protein [Chloroflexi bacterium]|nr:zf-HC2 domain-containing protein [Chloroflexota bacterium]
MTCDECVEYLHPFLDRELDEGEVVSVEGHLGRCPECLHFFDFRRELKRVVRVMGCGEVAPAALREAVARLALNL